MMEQAGDVVGVHYRTFSAEGILLEQSGRGLPLEFSIGGREAISGLGLAVAGLSLGESRQLSVPPEQAFGDRRDDWQLCVPRELLPPGVREGDQLVVEYEGRPLDVWVRSVRGDDVILDANHPLAGEPLVMRIRRTR